VQILVIESAMYWWFGAVLRIYFKWFKLENLFYVMCTLFSSEVCIVRYFVYIIFNAMCLNDKTKY